MKEIFTPARTQAILEIARELDQAATFEGNTQRPFSIQKITIPLDTAPTNARKVGFQFKSVYIESATDPQVTIRMKPNSNDQYQSAVTLKQNDSWTRSLPVSEAWLEWDAQAGKEITLVFFVDSEFRSGSQVSVSGGGVSISEGTAFSHEVVTLVAATAGVVAASNSLRKVTQIQNISGSDIWVGDSGVLSSGATTGIKVGNGDTYLWKNTAELYAYSVGGGDVVVFEET